MNKWLYRILLIFFSAIFLVSAGILLQYFIESRKQTSHYDKLSDLIGQVQQTPNSDKPNKSDSANSQEDTEPLPSHVTIIHPETGETIEILREYAQIFPQNPDLIGWIRIDGTKLDYPVVHAPDQKDFYLTHNFYKESSKHGCVYAQENNDVLLPSDNVTLYGHRMKDGSMFATLHNYMDLDYLKAHPTITFDTIYDHHTYQIISVFLTTASVGEGFPYHEFVDAANEEEFDQFVATCQELSLHDIGVDAKYGDKLITLSTCEYSQVNGRLVVVAKRID